MWRLDLNVYTFVAVVQLLRCWDRYRYAWMSVACIFYGFSCTFQALSSATYSDDQASSGTMKTMGRSEECEVANYDDGSLFITCIILIIPVIL